MELCKRIFKLLDRRQKKGIVGDSQSLLSNVKRGGKRGLLPFISHSFILYLKMMRGGEKDLLSGPA
jgi:hypothetical protein